MLPAELILRKESDWCRRPMHAIGQNTVEHRIGEQEPFHALAGVKYAALAKTMIKHLVTGEDAPALQAVHFPFPGIDPGIPRPV